jgi:hypothetical protein
MGGLWWPFSSTFSSMVFLGANFRMFLTWKIWFAHRQRIWVGKMALIHQISILLIEEPARFLQQVPVGSPNIEGLLKFKNFHI